MTTSELSPQVRILVCVVCGATLDVPLAGGWVRCPHCHSDNNIAPRITPGATEAKAVLAEEVRLARLRAQSGRPLHAPHAIRHLYERGTLDQSRRKEAIQEWQRALSELAAAKAPGAPPAPDDAEERLSFLTRTIYTPSDSEPRERRAHLEAALEHLEDPVARHRIYSSLVGAAVRVGDLVAAEQWLVQLDPHSDDLDIDTAHRVAKASLAMARGQYDEVIAVVGTNLGDVPIANDLDTFMAALRANAHELAGRVPLATEQLVEQMLRVGIAEELFAKWSKNNPQLTCAQSLPAARAVLAQSAGTDVVVSKGPGSGIGTLLFFLAVAALVVAAHVLGTATWDEDSQGQAGLGAAVFLLVVGLIVRARRAGVSKRLRGELRTVGIAARARVLQRRERPGLAGRKVADLDLLVSIPGRTRFSARHRELLTVDEAAEAQPGKNVAVLIHPEDSRRIAVDCS